MSRIAAAPLVLLAALSARAATAATADQVLLVVNADSPVSQAIGRAYAQARSVANVLTIRCQDSATDRAQETMSEADFTAQVERPVRAWLMRHQEIDYIVLTKGVPIRVDGAATGETFGFDGRPQASVDGQLAALGYESLPDATKVRFDDPDGAATGTAWLNRYWNADGPFRHATYGGYIVTRLDGYTEADARALVTRALAAERRPPRGPVLLDVQPDFGIDDPDSQPAALGAGTITDEWPYATWNADLVHAARDLAERRVPVRVDLAPGFAGDRRPLQGYFSFGSNDGAFSASAYESLGFEPGAIGDTAVSTSARSLLPPGSDDQSAIGDLVAHGITGVKGYIEEPLLQAIASPTIALDRYTRGRTLGESLAAASRFVGWTDLLIGDPLASPYPTR